MGVRPFRAAFEAISKDPLAIRRRNANTSARPPSGGGFAPGPGRAVGSGVRSGFGGGDVLPGRRARREARVEQREQAFAALPPPVPSERPFDELPVQVLLPKSVQDAEAPALEVREHAVDPLEDFMRGRVSDRDRRVVLQPVVAGPAVGHDPGSRFGGILEERLQRRAGLVHDPAELDAAGTVLPEHLDRSGDHQPALVAAPARRRLGALETIGNARLVRLHVHDQRKPVGGVHRPADLVHQRPGRLVAPQAQMALELQSRHPVRVRSHDVDGPMPASQRHVRAVHERPGRRRGLLPAVAALVDAARPLEPDRVPAPAVRANEAVRPSAPEEILRASFVVREHPLEPVGGQRNRKFGLIRHAPLMA